MDAGTKKTVGRNKTKTGNGSDFIKLPLAIFQ